MSRIKEKFYNLSKNNKKALGIFLTAGDPDFENSLSLIVNLPKHGVDFIEIGMPFSDPMADGPSIQLSSQRAIKSGMNLTKCLDLVRMFREKDEHTPVILMGYYNPIYQFGKHDFIKKCLDVGVDGLLIVDLPPEEDEEFYIEAEENNLSVIRLVTPTSNQDRLEKILKNATGFIYYVSITGITGTQSPELDDVNKNLKILKSVSDLPIIIGFGIRSPNQAFIMANISDGIVVGSAVIDIITSSLDDKSKPTRQTIGSCLKFINEISEKIKHN